MMTLFPIITVLVDIPISRTQVSPYIFPNTCHSFWSFSPAFIAVGTKQCIISVSTCLVLVTVMCSISSSCTGHSVVFFGKMSFQVLCAPFLVKLSFRRCCVFWISNLCHICHLQVFLSFVLLNEFWGTLKFLVWIVTRSFSPTHKFPKNQRLNLN